MTRMLSLAFSLATALVMLPAAQTDRPATLESGIDTIFARWTSSTPGCAVGASMPGSTLTRAYGMADLEHDVKITPDTIFEAGSVSKQFTAAAVLLLARDGKLSIDDPVRKYIPELPDYGASASARDAPVARSGETSPPRLGGEGRPLTIRHMLNHTSGLRDWGSVAGLSGWPRTSRAYTHDHVLDIVSRQRALNFPPGTRWSYSNTGFNLAAVIVSRVSGMSFADFSRTRIFEPLGMTRTSWRDDHTRIVKGRAIAYADQRGEFRTQMPFENVHGNGGLLTTVGDLLKWNQNFVSPKVGDAAFVKEQQQVGTFNDGRAHQYAYGLRVGTYKGVPEVSHSGSTAGYRAHLIRYPAQSVSIAVLCNVSSGAATQYAHAVADLYLANQLKAVPPPAPAHTLTAAEIDAVTGMYRNTLTGTALTIVRDSAGVRLERGGALVPMSGSKLVTAGRDAWEFDGKGGARVTDEFGSVETYQRVQPAKPTRAQLQEFAGTYVSDEAETTVVAAVDGDALVLKRRPATTVRLTPLYADAFSAPQFGTVIFRRDGAGKVAAMSVSQDRVWDLRFSRQADVKQATGQD